MNRQPDRCTGVESGGCLRSEYWSDPPKLKRRKDGSYTYKDYTITYDPPPIPDRGADWRYVHDDYDGAPDSGDGRMGYGATLRACCLEIEEIKDDDDIQRG